MGEDRANLSAVVYLLLCGFCLERFPLPLGGRGGGGYFKKFLTGCAGRTLKTPPIRIMAKPEKHTYSYNLT